MIGAVTGAIFGLGYGLFKLTENPIIYDAAGKVIGVLDTSIKFFLNNGVDFYNIKDPLTGVSTAIAYAVSSTIDFSAAGTIVDTIFVVKNLVDGTFAVLNENGSFLNEQETLRILVNEKMATIEKAWEQEKIMVDENGSGTISWTNDQKNELLTQGKVSGYYGYLGKSLNAYPEYVNNPNNVYFLRYDQRLNLFVSEDNCVIWQTITNWPLLNRS
jgi:hypothetical protein